MESQMLFQAAQSSPPPMQAHLTIFLRATRQAREHSLMPSLPSRTSRAVWHLVKSLLVGLVLHFCVEMEHGLPHLVDQLPPLLFLRSTCYQEERTPSPRIRQQLIWSRLRVLTP